MLGPSDMYFRLTDYLLQVFFQLLSISHRIRMCIVVIYDVIVLRLRLLFSRILIDYEKNENKTPSKIYTITVHILYGITYKWLKILKFHGKNRALYAEIKVRLEALDLINLAEISKLDKRRQARR